MEWVQRPVFNATPLLGRPPFPGFETVFRSRWNTKPLLTLTVTDAEIDEYPSEIIAHAVLGLNVRVMPPERLLSGDEFVEAGVYGVVEADFFDWVIRIEGGLAFIRTFAKRLMRFVWSDVNQTSLKFSRELYRHGDEKAPRRVLHA